MSSDSDFSDDDVKPVKKELNDSDPDHKSKRRAKAKSKTFVESNSGSSDEEEDAKPSSSRKRKAPMNKGTAKKRGKGRAGSEDELGPGAAELELTEEDRIKIQGMSEKDREQEIFKRIEEMEARKIREKIAEKLEQKSKKEESPEERGRGRKKDRRVVSDESDRSLSSEREVKPHKNKKVAKKESDVSDEEGVRVMPSEANKKKKQKSAMEDLLMKRKEKEAKKASLAVDAVFGTEKDSSSESSSSNSSRSSSPSSRSSSPPSRSASPSKEDQAAKRPVDCLDELLLARLSRFKLAKFVHAPFFRTTVLDCYVRIGAGPVPGKPNKDNYRIAQIVDVVETAKNYDLEHTKTNKGLKLRFGNEDRVYRLAFVSNQSFNNAEFQEWMTVMKKCNKPLPSMGEIQKKQRDIHNALNHNYTNEEVDAMIKEKARWKETPKNFAMTKGELMKQLEYAKQNQMHAEVQRLQSEIDKVDSKADELDKKRSGDITAIDWINKRNRNMMKEQFLGEKKIEGFFGKEDDPFTRKSGKMRVVSGSAKNLAALDEEANSGGISASSSASNLSSTPIITKTPSLPAALSKTPDLFSFHSINVNNELTLNSLRTPVTEDPSRTIHPTSTPSSQGRPLSLADYRKRKLEAKTPQASSAAS